MMNAITIDVEYWWCNEFLANYLPEKRETIVGQATKLILDLFDKHNVTTTFFILGSVAESHPEIVEMIYERGHEIGSHAYSHTPLYRLTKEEVEKEIQRTNHILYKITKERPKGFRAPHASITNENKWIFETLEKYSFLYDSSIFPVKTMLYGVPNAPLSIYRPSKEDISKHDPNAKIVEVPISALSLIRFGKYRINLPIGGGFYIRTYPLWFIKTIIKKINKEGRPFVAYIHPWEIFPKLPRLSVPSLIRFEAYNGTGIKLLQKMESMIKTFRIAPIRDIIDNI